VPSVQILRWHPLFTALWLSSLCILTSQAMIFPLRVLSICAGGLTLRQAATRCKDRRRTEKETIWQIRPYKREDTPLSSTFLLWSRSAGPGALWQSRYVEHRHSP
jgi:hypothetical protein